MRFAMLLAVSSLAHAATLYVSPNPGDYPTLNAAVAAADAGDVIRIDTMAVSGNLTIDEDDLTILDATPYQDAVMPEIVTIDAQRVVIDGLDFYAGGRLVVLQGDVTVKNGRIDGPGYGYAATVHGGTGLTLKNVDLAGWGTAVLGAQGASVTARGTTFASSAVGLSSGGDVDVRRCDFIDVGDAIKLYADSAILRRNYIEATGYAIYHGRSNPLEAVSNVVEGGEVELWASGLDFIHNTVLEADVVVRDPNVVPADAFVLNNAVDGDIVAFADPAVRIEGNAATGRITGLSLTNVDRLSSLRLDGDYRPLSGSALQSLAVRVTSTWVGPDFLGDSYGTRYDAGAVEAPR